MSKEIEKAAIEKYPTSGLYFTAADHNRAIHLRKGYVTGATEWAAKAKSLADAIMLIYKDGSGKQTTIDQVNKALIEFYGNQNELDNALAKYKEVTNEVLPAGKGGGE